MHRETIYAKFDMVEHRLMHCNAVYGHTKNALPYFDSITNGWIDYSHNQTLVKMFSLALNATEQGHAEANKLLQTDIERLRLRR